jgi:hypothetical protein
METITKTFNIYNFDELSEDTKEHLIKKECEILTEEYCDYYLKEDMEEEAKELIKKTFGEKAVFQGIYYSLSYCQGDGAMVEFDLVYYGKNLSIKHDNYCHYYHENSFKIIENNEGLTKKQHEQLHKKIYNINKQLTKYGYSFIEYDRTEQAIEQLNNYEFYENGDIY